MDDPRQEVVQHDVLVVESHELLNIGEWQARIIRQDTIMKSQEKPLKLGNNAVLVVAWISDERAPRIGSVARQVLRVGVAALERIAEQERVVSGVQVRLIVRPTSINVIQIERGSAKVYQRIGVILFLQAARWVERNVMIDELTQVSVQRRDAAFLFILAVMGRIEAR